MSLLLAASASAQVNGQLTGTVVDRSGASVSKAQASLYLTSGDAALFVVKTNAAGRFEFAGVRPDYYRLKVEVTGFMTVVLENVKVDPGRETSLQPLVLEVAGATQTVEVTAGAEGVNVTSAEVATTVTRAQVENLPLLDRQIASLFITQAGVSNSRTVTSINGLRPSYSNILVDGVNIQDVVRTNAVDLIPNRLTIGQIAELTIATSNLNPTIGGNATTLSLTTASGTNQFHGNAYWYNRNGYFAANDWFNNAESVKRPFLNLNQFGGTFGGPIKKDKLLFMANYESYRERLQTPQTNTILLPNARQGLLTYADGSGATRTFDVLAGKGLTIDPYIRGLLQQIPSAGNSLSRGDQLNTTGYSFNAQNNDSRDIAMGKLDYYLSQAHAFSGSFVHTRQTTDRPDYTGFYTTEPTIYNKSGAKFFSASWRWSARPTLTNELRGGFNLAPVDWIYRGEVPAFTLTGLNFTSPVNPKLVESRTVNSYAIQDNANWVKGRHSLSFGFQASLWRNGSSNALGTVPSYAIGISTANTLGYRVGEIPGATQTDITRANGILASLGGMISGSAQTFNITGRESGFVPGAPQVLDLRMNNYAPYLSDTWRVREGLTLTLGVRWEYFSPVEEKNAFLVQPRLIDNNTVSTLLGNATLDFAGSAVGRPLYRRDQNSFGPNVGLAWDVFGNGRTALRAGYGIAYANDNTINTVYNSIFQNAGLSTNVQAGNLNARVSSLPPIATPAFRFPITTEELYNLNPTSSVEGLVDPHLATPYVQQWNLSLQQTWKGFVFEGRYVGNHVVKQLRQIDFNQIDPARGGFLDDFKRARNNGLLAYRATGSFNATYNPNIAGSQPLPFFNRLPSGGLLTNATVATLLQNNEPGTLAQTYQTAQPQLLPADDPSFTFFPNRYLLYSSLLSNISHSTYNAAQFEVRKRIRNGMQFQANYVFSKALSDAEVTRGLEAILDNNNFAIEKARSPFDLTHAFKINHYLPLPFGPGHRFNPSQPVLRRIAEGWALSGFLLVQSGPPVSIEAATGTAGVGRGTLNRGARSANNTADTNLTLSQLKEATGLYKRGNGVFFVNPAHINPLNGNGVAPDIDPPFSGQIFFNPQAGTVGSLQRRILDGPGFWDYDFSVIKHTPITERHNIELRADFFNLFNHPNFFAGDQNLNTSTFGRITGMLISGNGVGARMIQFGLFYRF